MFIRAFVVCVPKGSNEVSIERGLGRRIEKSLDRRIERSLGRRIERGLGKKIKRNLDRRISKNIERTRNWEKQKNPKKTSSRKPPYWPAASGNTSGGKRK